MQKFWILIFIQKNSPGAGVGGLISGQLTGSAGWSFPFLFNMAGFTSIACAIFFFVNYHTWGKKNEKIVAEYFKDYSRDQKIDSRTLKVTDLERSQMEGHGRFWCAHTFLKF